MRATRLQKEGIQDMKNSRFIPYFFRSRALWVLWRLEKNDKGKETKVPYAAAGYHASTTKADTWCSFQKAYETLQTGNYNGLGVVMVKELHCIFIDIDHCIDPETGALSDTAEDVLSQFPDTYCEISVSRTGIHIFALGTIPRDFKNSKAGVEMYSDKRYCAFTGDAIQPYEIKEAQSGLDYVYMKYQTAAALPMPDLPKGECLRSDESVIEKAMQRGHFRDLYYGKWEMYPSQSEADLALCCILAFWADRDEEVIDRIFRSSDLYRAKWDQMHGEQTYGEMTVRKALAAVTESYSEWKKKKNDEFKFCILSKW